MSSISQWFRRRRSRWNCIEERLQQLETDMATNREDWEAVIAAVNGAKETLAKIREDYVEMKRLIEEFMEKPEDAERRAAAVAAIQGFTQDLAGVDSEWPVVPPPPPVEE